jgi:hypothetical protein
MSSGDGFALHWAALGVGLVLIGPYVFAVFSNQVHHGEFAKLLNKLLIVGDVQRAKKLANAADGPLSVATNAALTMVLDGSALRQEQAEDYRSAGATTDPVTVKERLRTSFVAAFDEARKGRWGRRALAAIGACVVVLVAADFARRALFAQPLGGAVFLLVTLFWAVRRDLTERGEAVAMFSLIEDALYARALGPVPPAPRAPLAIIVEGPDEPAREVAIDQPVLKIGKLRSSHILLASELVARMHAEIANNDGALSIVDLGSTNGTKVNGEFINKSDLRDGDRITIGPFVLTVRVRS